MPDTLRLSGYLPAEENNGLKRHEVDFLAVDPPDPLLAIVRIERKQRAVDDDTGDTKASVRITAIEPLEGADAKAASAQLADLRTKRTGAVTLDIDSADVAS